MTRTATGVLAIVCVTAGAGGTFLALRNDAPPATAAEIQAPAAVAESEGVIERAPLPVPAVPEPAAPRTRSTQPAPAPRPPVRQAAAQARAPQPPVPAPVPSPIPLP